MSGLALSERRTPVVIAAAVSDCAIAPRTTTFARACVIALRDWPGAALSLRLGALDLAPLGWHATSAPEEGRVELIDLARGVIQGTWHVRPDELSRGVLVASATRSLLCTLPTITAHGSAPGASESPDGLCAGDTSDSTYAC